MRARALSLLPLVAFMGSSALLATGCPEEASTPSEPVIDVAGAVPQDTPVPAGSPEDASLPQIVSFDAPETVRPGQIVNLRLTTNFSPIDDLSSAAIVVEGVGGWFKADIEPTPGAESDAGAWVISIGATVATSADSNDLAGVDIALLGPDGSAGGYVQWRPSIDDKSGPLSCPNDSDCSGLSCGVDPLCGVVCGTCDLGEACSAGGSCEMIGNACPDAAVCGARECGPDPVCGASCGECGPGTSCSFDGTCEPDPNAPGVEVLQLVAGAGHVCARHVTGEIKCWGDHSTGQLGLGNVDRHGDEPDEMGYYLPVLDLGTDRTAVDLVTGGNHTCARLDDDSVKCWGSNSHGQLGLGDLKNRGDDDDEMGDALGTVDVGFSAVEQLCAGTDFTCAMSDAGAVKCWGGNAYGQLGQGDTMDRGGQAGQLGGALAAIDLGANATGISCKARHACALLEGGDVKCWGYNQDGQLGLEDVDARGDATGEMGGNLPTLSLGGKADTLVAAWSHSCVRMTGGGVRCWGDNPSGGLGLGDTVTRGDQPGTMGGALSDIDLGTSSKVMDLTVGFGHTCASFEDGSVRCWGFNGGGALGLGDALARGDQGGEMGSNLPAVDLGTDVTAVAVTAGNGFSCALVNIPEVDGVVKCWGSNQKGQLGQGDSKDRGDQSSEMGDALPFVDLW